MSVKISLHSMLAAHLDLPYSIVGDVFTLAMSATALHPDWHCFRLQHDPHEASSMPLSNGTILCCTDIDHSR